MNTEEFQFKVISEEPCDDCKEKNKEITLELPNYTFEELETIIPLLDKYGLTSTETQLIYNLHNRIFKTNKRPGCGKCFKQICKSLKIKYTELLNQK